MDAMSLLEVVRVSKVYEAHSRFTKRAPSQAAVKNVSFILPPGKTIGIVGESGSGKSTLLRMILRLLRPSEGQIFYRGQDIWKLKGAELLKLRREMQAIFQDPASSFNPRHKIGAILSAPLEVHGLGDRRSREEKVVATLAQMGLPADFIRRYPHQLSGGQKQRVAIARAIILGPSLVLADEPTSALDVSVQAQILSVFRDTKEKLGLTTMFVSHNLAVIRYVSDHVAVMRQGEIVETGESETIFSNPTHSYTQALLQAVPDPKRRRGRPAARWSSIDA
jgi:ABC-type glutathione transport system ATPase component